VNFGQDIIAMSSYQRTTPCCQIARHRQTRMAGERLVPDSSHSSLTDLPSLDQSISKKPVQYYKRPTGNGVTGKVNAFHEW
jgi:hypothetical protein